MNGSDLALAAEALVGTPFRLHGRDPASGLDCLGVLNASLAALGLPSHLPTGYRLRMRSLPDFGSFVAGCGLVAVAGDIAPGDAVMVRIGPVQFHVLVAGNQGCFIHAHAGLRRVVSGEMPPASSIVGHWRLRYQD